jgi:hypothetical protein
MVKMEFARRRRKLREVLAAEQSSDGKAGLFSSMSHGCHIARREIGEKARKALVASGSVRLA